MNAFVIGSEAAGNVWEYLYFPCSFTPMITSLNCGRAQHEDINKAWWRMMAPAVKGIFYNCFSMITAAREISRQACKTYTEGGVQAGV